MVWTRAAAREEATPEGITTRAAARAAAAGANTSSPAASTAIVPFRFFDLPPELRNNIYSHLIQKPKTRDLRTLEEPAITAVSHLVRNESLPVLFADGTFELVIGADLRRRVCGHKPWFSSKTSSGTLGIKPYVMTYLKRMGDAVVLRDITFRICNVTDLYRCRENAGSHSESVDTMVLAYQRMQYSATEGLELSSVRETTDVA